MSPLLFKLSENLTCYNISKLLFSILHSFHLWTVGLPAGYIFTNSLLFKNTVKCIIFSTHFCLARKLQSRASIPGSLVFLRFQGLGCLFLIQADNVSASNCLESVMQKEMVYHQVLEKDIMQQFLKFVGSD